MTDPMHMADAPHPVADAFRQELWTRDGMNVLEIGTKKWDPSFTSHHKAWAPRAEHYVMADVEAGDDVDVVTDAHDLNFVGGQFDALICIAVLEHLSRPWIAAQEMARVLATGGILYCQSHQSFMLHNYGPTGEGDYFRFSRSALELLFVDAGLEVVASSYTYPVDLIPRDHIARWATDHEAYLCVDLYARKPSA